MKFGQLKVHGPENIKKKRSGSDPKLFRNSWFPNVYALSAVNKLHSRHQSISLYFTTTLALDIHDGLVNKHFPVHFIKRVSVPEYFEHSTCKND